MRPTGIRPLFATATLALALASLSVSAWPAELFRDDFQRTGLGSEWKVVDDPSPGAGPSNWQVSNGALLQTSNIYRSDNEYEFWQGTHIVAGSSSWTDYSLKAEVTSGDDDGWGLIVRYQDPSNYYRFITVADSGNGGPFRRLEKFVDGKRTVLAEEKKAFDPGKPMSVDLVAKEGRIALWIDGKICISAADRTFGSGKIGFMSYANTGLAIRGVRVESLDGAAPPTTIQGDVSYTDNFDREEIGRGWLVVDDPDPASGPSHWFISNGALRQDSNIYRAGNWETYFQGTHIVAGASIWSDYEVSAEVKSDDDDGWGVIARYVDKDNYYRFITVADSGNQGPFMRIDRMEDGKPTVLVEKREAFTPGKMVRVRLRVSGNSISAWLDDRQVLTATDSKFAAGKFGFMTYADSGCSFDNLVVRGVR